TRRLPADRPREPGARGRAVDEGLLAVAGPRALPARGRVPRLPNRARPVDARVAAPQDPPPDRLAGLVSLEAGGGAGARAGARRAAGRLLRRAGGGQPGPLLVPPDGLAGAQAGGPAVRAGGRRPGGPPRGGRQPPPAGP